MPLNKRIYQSKLNLTLGTKYTSINNLEQRVNTFSINYPKVDSYFSDMTENQVKNGGMYHNMTDVTGTYRFIDVESIKIVVISKSEQSQFDFGVQLSLFSTYHNDWINKNWKYGAIVFGAFFFLYCIYLYYSYKRKIDARNYTDFDEDASESNLD